MRLVGLRIQAFRGWLSDATIDLSSTVTLLVGDNRTGKSSTTNAIEWCLYGSRVEKKSVGLEERAEWEVRPRDAGDADTVVTLVFETDRGRVELTRRRTAAAKARSSDLEVHREGEAPLADAEAEAWLGASDLPTWDQYRRAHCFHQEAARTRVTDSGDRSAVLAALLGLDEDVGVRERIHAQLRPDLVREVDGVLENVERSLRDRLTHPHRELLAAERSLADRGITRAELGADLPARTRRKLVERARSLSQRLGIDVEIPAPEDADAVRAWARTWPETVARAATGSERLEPLLRQHGELAAARSAAQPAQDAWRKVQARRRDAVEKGGDEAARAARRKEAEAARKDADEALRRTNALAAVLQEARALIPDGEAASDCPVCRTSIDALGPRVDEALAGLRSEEVAGRVKARDEAHGASRTAQQEVEVLARWTRDERTARDDYEGKRRRLAALLDVDPEEAARDLVAAAGTKLEEIVQTGQGLRALETELTTARSAHQDDLDLLRELERWDGRRIAAERVVDLDALDAAQVLDAAIDDAAAFAADIEALDGMAREAQEERSTRREAEVNEGLQTYYGLITGDTAAVRLQVHRTPKKLTYRLIDAEGRPAVPVLNQAALNALSLAMLFAQAERRGQQAGEALVVLDDPVQSLDESRQDGLARAIERLTETCRVVVAATPSRFVERVRDTVSAPRLLHVLAPWDPARGALVERSETL